MNHIFCAAIASTVLTAGCFGLLSDNALAQEKNYYHSHEEHDYLLIKEKDSDKKPCNNAPEPFTMLGAVAALGFGVVLKKKR